MVRGWRSRTHQPLGSKQDKKPVGIPMIPSVAVLCEGQLYLQREPIHLQEWPQGDFKWEERMSGKYHRLLKLAPSSAQVGARTAYAQGD